MKNINLSHEVLAELIAKVGVLASNDNKVRLDIGNRDNGNGLASIATIVNGGAMIRVGFLTQPPKKAIDLETTSPYMHFILRARDFVSYAGALLPYKAEVTLTEEDSKVIFSVGEGTKVSVNKVAIETAEPMLEEDYMARVAQVRGESFMETLEKGGFSATLSGQGSDFVTIKIGNGKMDVFSAATAGASHFNCPVEVTMAQAGIDAKAYLINHAKELDEEQRTSFKAELAAVVNDPEKVKDLARSLGWKEPAMNAPEPTRDVTFALSTANWRLMTKLYGGDKAVAVIVTPKNLHVLSGGVKATFALSVVNQSIIKVVESLDRFARNVRMVVDKDAFLGSLSLMKLGDREKPCSIKANKTALCLEKVGAGISGRVPFVTSEGDLAIVKGAFSGDLLSSVVGALRAGNVLVGYSSVDAPIFLSNGNLEAEGIGYHALLGIKMPAARSEKAQAPADTAEELAE